jgi:NADPH-dependent 2,4-dienoyl-CoA reductase/sulfur reductase-like enzyme
MATEVIPLPKSEITESIIDLEQTTCCVVGGGPGGMMLARLLARRGISVTLLEAHKDLGGHLKSRKSFLNYSNSLLPNIKQVNAGGSEQVELAMESE